MGGKCLLAACAPFTARSVASLQKGTHEETGHKARCQLPVGKRRQPVENVALRKVIATWRETQVQGS